MKGLRRFWLLGIGAAALFYHSNGILIGTYTGFDILPYDMVIIWGIGEFFFAIVLISAFIAKLVIWWHDRPREPKSFVNDPGIIS